MTINDIMIREIAEAEREERAAERAAEQRGIAQGERLVGCAGVAAVALLVALGVVLRERYAACVPGAGLTEGRQAIWRTKDRAASGA